MSVKWMESQRQVQKAKKIARDIAPTGNEGVGALMFYVSNKLEYNLIENWD